MRSFACILLILVQTFLLAPGTLFAQGSLRRIEQITIPHTFRDLPVLRAERIALELDPTTKKLRLEVDSGVFEVPLEIRVKLSATGRIITWLGTGIHLVTSGSGLTAGYVQIGHEHWSVLPKHGEHILLKVDPKAFPGCGVPDSVGLASLLPQEKNVAGKPASTELIAESAIPVQDVLVPYTAKVLNEMGGHDEVAALAEFVVDYTNMAYEESGASMRIRLVGPILSTFDEDESSAPCTGCSPLLRIVNNVQGELSRLREQYHADLVSILVEAAGERALCGIASPYEGTVSKDKQFSSAVLWRCLPGSPSTFAHELGHSQGLQHDPITGCASRAGLPSGPCGHFNCEACFPVGNGQDCGWRTIMSYDVCPQRASSIPRFSTPLRFYYGEILGVPNERDNVRVLNFTAATIAAFRESPSQFPRFLTDSDFPGFRFEVLIQPSEGAPLVFGTSLEEGCPPETLCVAGSLPDRAEAFLRIIGPRPNGYLWPTIIRFTPARIEIGIEQIATRTVRRYVLEAVGPPGENLSGLQDRMGFPAN